MGLSVINWGGVTNHQLSESSKYPLQTDIATKEFQRIEALRASTSQYGLTKISTASDITGSDSIALSASEKNPNVAGSIMNQVSNSIDYWSRRTVINYNGELPSVGWYRIAKSWDTVPNIDNIMFRGDLGLYRAWRYLEPEVHYMHIENWYSLFGITHISSISKTHTIKNIRLSYNSSTNRVYIDILYDNKASNPLYVSLINKGPNIMIPCDIVATPESDASETYRDAVSIPANT